MSLNSSFSCLLIIYFNLVNTINAQSFDYYNDSLILNCHHYNQNIGFSQITNINNELLDPIIKLNSSDELQLSFDIFENSYNGSYAYTFIHCNANWALSTISQYDYIDGYTNNIIENYSYSFNTTTSYINYNITFPNKDIQFSKSGNYILLIYDSDKNKPLITKRFIIYEDLISIHINVKQSTLVQDINKKHEIDFSITNYTSLNISNFYNDINVIVQQNNDWNNIITNLRPSFINRDVIEFNYYDEISFLAGSEYRDFDTKNLGYYGNGIQSYNQLAFNDSSLFSHIQTKGKSYHNIGLYKDYPNDIVSYSFQYDLNGKYVISIGNNKNKTNESDYALVNFSLQLNELKNNHIYIYGELTNYHLSNKHRMTYNHILKKYEGSLYLKQGYYNYKYILTDTMEKEIENVIELNYKETRNKYTIYVYHTPIWLEYDRIVGIIKSTSNTLN